MTGSLVSNRLARLLSNRASNTGSTIFPLSKRLVKRNNISRVSRTGRRRRPKRHLGASGGSPIFRFLVVLVCPGNVRIGVQVKEGSHARAIFGLLHLLKVTSGTPKVVGAVSRERYFLG